MMTVLEQRFMEVATRQLPLLNKNLEKIIKLLEDGISRSMDEVGSDEGKDRQ